MLAVFIILAIFVFIIWGSIVGAKKSKEKKLKMADKGAIIYFTANHVEGLGISPNAPCDVIQFNDRIQIDSRDAKFTIPLSNVRAAVIKSERELIEKGKSVVGRAMIGTLLVPGLGTIVGGMSGIGTKQKKGKYNNFLIINYINSRGEMDAVTFLNNLNLIKMKKFCESVNDSASLSRAGEAIQL